MPHQLYLWIGFHFFLGTMLAIDLGIFQRKAHAPTVREALAWTAVWVGIALLFGIGIYVFQGAKLAVQFYTAYLIEESLSVDNIFVFLMIFSHFRVPPAFQHKVLFWGILGAIVFRLTFILAGVALIKEFHWIIYLFGAFLIFAGIQMAFQKTKEIHPDRNPVFRMLRPFMASRNYDDARFFIRRNGRLLVTPLFVVLMVIESSDIVFAIDSVPAVLSITLNPFIAYTSNALAILGLRSLYFALRGLMSMFHYLHYGLAAILVFVGVKMLASDFVKIPPPAALLVIAVILIVAILASLIHQSRSAQSNPEEQAPRNGS
ncbi:MAG: TerC family protein [Chitinivibrionia bacterium]|nr:TerC family protein [Chitinivibrionia bacterium]